jgi:hypothetical protein
LTWCEASTLSLGLWPQPFCYFFDRVSWFSLDHPWTTISTPTTLPLLEWQICSSKLDYCWHQVSLTFSSSWPQTMIFLITAAQLVEIIDMDYHDLQTLDILRLRLQTLKSTYSWSYPILLCVVINVNYWSLG